jgi:hypothetical protein
LYAGGAWFESQPENRAPDYLTLWLSSEKASMDTLNGVKTASFHILSNSLFALIQPLNTMQRELMRAL